jgi:hypothetical protein
VNDLLKPPVAPDDHEALTFGPLPDTKATNPKDALGSRRLPLELIPFPALAHESLALLDGKGKYGAANYRAEGVRASVYVAAALRHVQRYNNGEELDPKSGVHNLGCARACLAILLDAIECGVLVDDRPPAQPNLEAFQDRMNDEASRIVDMHAGKNPRHYTIADSVGAKA